MQQAGLFVFTDDQMNCRMNFSSLLQARHGWPGSSFLMKSVQLRIIV